MTTKQSRSPSRRGSSLASISSVIALIGFAACSSGSDDGATDAPGHTVDAPVTDAPGADGPLADAAPDGAIDAPIDASAIDAPAIDAPAIDAPAIDAPAIDAPAIDAPAIDAGQNPGPDATPDASGTLSLALTGATPTSYAGHTASAGSTMANDLCPAGAVLTGLRGRLRGTDLYNGPIWGACTPIVLMSSPLAITTGTPTTDLPVHGSVQTGDTVWARDCPAGQVIVSVTGRAGAIIDQLVVQCAPLTVGAAAPYPVTIGATTALPLAGDAGGGSVFAPPTCAAGQIAMGVSTYFEGNPGFGLPMIYLDGFALVCTTPTVQ